MCLHSVVCKRENQTYIHIVSLKNKMATSSTNLPEYLLLELEKIANDKDLCDYDIEQDAGSKHGDGFMATMVNITLRGKCKNAGKLVTAQPLHLICKLLPTNTARRELFNSVNVFEREVHMYNTILPAIRMFQEAKGLTDETGFFQYPNCYCAVSDVVKDHHYIIMDDLRPQGYVLWDKLKSIEYENVKLLMIALGRFHGLTFAIRDQKPDLFKRFKEMEDVMLQMILMNDSQMDAIFNSTLDRMLKLFEADKLVHEHLQVVHNTWKDVFIKCLGMDARNGICTVVNHGDCWNNNMMFRNNGNVSELYIYSCLAGPFLIYLLFHT